MQKPRTSTTPQTNLENHLFDGRLDLAALDLVAGAHLDIADAKRRERLWQCAVGPWSAPPQVQLAGWQWLLDRGFPLPTKDRDAIFRQVLESRPLVLADWLEKQWGPLTKEASVLRGALGRSDLDALEWLSARGLPLDFPRPEQPVLQTVLMNKKLEAGPFIAWLLDHGVQPKASCALGGYSAQRPLPILVDVYEKQVKNTMSSSSQGIKNNQFRQLWELLVGAGEDPHPPKGPWPTPRQRVKKSGSADWLVAFDRANRSLEPSTHDQLEELKRKRQRVRA